MRRESTSRPRSSVPSQWLLLIPAEGCEQVLGVRIVGGDQRGEEGKDDHQQQPGDRQEDAGVAKEPLQAPVLAPTTGAATGGRCPGSAEVTRNGRHATRTFGFK